MFDLTKPEFTAKERVLILFKEYDSLREEIIRRSDSHNRFITVVGGVIAATLAVGTMRINFENGFENPNIHVLIGVIAVLVSGAWITASVVWRHTRRLRQRSRRLGKADRYIGWW
jgi:hypothetical protein